VTITPTNLKLFGISYLRDFLKLIGIALAFDPRFALPGYDQPALIASARRASSVYPLRKTNGLAQNV